MIYQIYMGDSEGERDGHREGYKLGGGQRKTEGNVDRGGDMY